MPHPHSQKTSTPQLTAGLEVGHGGVDEGWIAGLIAGESMPQSRIEKRVGAAGGLGEKIGHFRRHFWGVQAGGDFSEGHDGETVLAADGKEVDQKFEWGSQTKRRQYI